MAPLHKLWRKIVRLSGAKDASYYDMFEHAGERFFARLYVEFILSHLKTHFGAKAPLSLCDAGCQTGRIAIPLAREGHQVTGIDTSHYALKRASHHAKEEGLRLQWIHKDILGALDRIAPSSFDAIVCLEVLYLNKNYRDMLASFRRVVKPEGLVFISHRPAHYYAVKALEMKDFETAQFVMSYEEGELWGSYFNWQTLDQLKKLYQASGFEIQASYPIGVFSGTGNERTTGGMDPATLDSQTLDSLAKIEVEAGSQADWRGLGRYTLVVARPK